jgi:hypothetical protein
MRPENSFAKRQASVVTLAWNRHDNRSNFLSESEFQRKDRYQSETNNFDDPVVLVNGVNVQRLQQRASHVVVIMLLLCVLYVNFM